MMTKKQMKDLIDRLNKFGKDNSTALVLAACLGTVMFLTGYHIAAVKAKEAEDHAKYKIADMSEAIKGLKNVLAKRLKEAELKLKEAELKANKCSGSFYDGEEDCNKLEGKNSITYYDPVSNSCYVSMKGNPNDKAKFVNEIIPWDPVGDLYHYPEDNLSMDASKKGILNFSNGRYVVFLNDVKIKTLEEDLVEQCQKDKNCKCEENQNGNKWCEAHIKDAITINNPNYDSLIPGEELINRAYVLHNESYDEFDFRDGCSSSYKDSSCKYDLDRAGYPRHKDKIELNFANNKISMKIVFDNAKIVSDYKQCKNYCTEQGMVSNVKTKEDYEKWNDCDCVKPEAENKKAPVEQQVQKSNDKHTMLMKGIMYNKMFGRI